MAKKQILTYAEIEKDIIHALKYPPSTSEASYKKGTVPAIILAVFLVVMEFIYPKLVTLILLAVIVFLIGYGIFNHIRLNNRIKNVSIDDYDIKVETVHSVDEEHYRAERGGKPRRTDAVHNYIIRFENGKEWRMPRENYTWSERLRMHALGVYQTTHRGDSMTVVTKKETGEIVTAYHSDLFEYKN